MGSTSLAPPIDEPATRVELDQKRQEVLDVKAQWTILEMDIAKRDKQLAVITAKLLQSQDNEERLAQSLAAYESSVCTLPLRLV